MIKEKVFVKNRHSANNKKLLWLSAIVVLCCIGYLLIDSKMGNPKLF